MTVLTRVREGYSYAGETTLAVITCPTCGITYAIPERLRDQAQRRGEGRIQWYCPNGDQLGFHGKSEEDKLQARLDRESDRAARLAAERDQAKASAAAYKGVATRTRKRAKHGVCPCCNRTFKELARHMKSQHPDFAAEV